MKDPIREFEKARARLKRQAKTDPVAALALKRLGETEDAIRRSWLRAFDEGFNATSGNGVDL